MGYSPSLDEDRIARRLLVIVLALLVLAGSVNAEGWADKIKIKGDLRYRFEWYGKEIYDGEDLLDTLDSRCRNRVRARLGVVAKPEDNLELYVGLASGSSDPVSTNQTFDDYFTSKAVNLDLAYFKWKPIDGGWITGGKIRKPWHLAGKAFWDGDLNPEGLAMGYDTDFGAVSPFLNLSYLWVDEIKHKQAGGENDVMLYLGQGGADFKFGSAKLMITASYITFTNIKGHAFFNEAFGNTEGEDEEMIIDTLTGDTSYVAVPNGAYAYGYDVIQPSFKLHLKFGEFPVTVYGDVVMNINPEVSDENMGYMTGIVLGKAKKPGSFEVSANYGALQKDCMVGTFVDSDFAGGGTNSNGMKFAGAVQITKKIKAGATFFANTQKPASDTPKGYYRFQGDLKFKF